MVDVLIRPRFERKVDAEGIRRAAQAALRHQGAPSGASLSVVVVDDDEIRALNRQFRGIDAPTDVLSFGTLEDEPSGSEASRSGFVVAPEEAAETAAYLGDVIVAWPRVVAQAAEQGHSVQRELDLLVVHGTLHLLGHDHATAQEEASMWAIQDQVLDGLGQENYGQALD
jgi:probable rRNA maturation factor